jgi:hypothetical protein
VLPYNKFFSDKSTFFCFTPMVSLATFIIELSLAGYVLFRYGLNNFSRVSIFIMLLLGSFQLAEYLICSGGDPQMWSKFGTIAITLLPAAGLHMVSMLTRPTRWTGVGYLFAGLLVAAVIFLQVPILPQCTGKFMLLKFETWFDILFNIYYGLFIFIALEMIVRTWRQHKGNKKQLFWAMVAYLIFIIPTALVFLVISLSKEAIPSIMCGFAVLGALILVFKEMPVFYKAPAKNKRRK